ncbi:MAG: hypothetical protein E6J65_03520 [Deltaproteobacteria bacterium]|nr:MAG: hypothetical protein E6J63_17175 [Deltaproteobacteria bacterium]TMB28735.1 MAG: hypothetical protein E6J65_03520 [Deltaproteobacteria bacterium]
MRAIPWPSSTEVFAAPMNEIPKVVFSTSRFVNPAGNSTPAEASWAAARVAGGDLASEIARLKQESGKEIMAHGGAGFARSLVRLGLVDEYRLLIHPVALGRGLGLFSSLPGRSICSVRDFMVRPPSNSARPQNNFGNAMILAGWARTPAVVFTILHAVRNARCNPNLPRGDAGEFGTAPVPRG